MAIVEKRQGKKTQQKNENFRFLLRLDVKVATHKSKRQKHDAATLK
ncbi:MAG: hypothetical protein J5943_09710 [Oribacterium sp.]|jgi:hypothetical protein|nr:MULTISPECIES: hypothetical protein [unclassified Oribacterium]MBO5598858.1 hypothetical protein [Oribacterium sp.]MBP3804030.1 hypothetical protein [Oribacterium sp.]